MLIVVLFFLRSKASWCPTAKWDWEWGRQQWWEERRQERRCKLVDQIAEGLDLKISFFLILTVLK